MRTHNPPKRKAILNSIFCILGIRYSDNKGMGEQSMTTSVMMLTTVVLMNTGLRPMHLSFKCLFQTSATGRHWNAKHNSRTIWSLTASICIPIPKWIADFMILFSFMSRMIVSSIKNTNTVRCHVGRRKHLGNLALIKTTYSEYLWKWHSYQISYNQPIVHF